MKSLAMIVVAMLIGAYIAKAQDQMPDHVVTKMDTIFCSVIHHGLSNLKVRLADGSAQKIELTDIVRYTNEGKLYMRAPVYNHNKRTNRTKLMEAVKFKNGIFLLKEEHYNGAYDSMDTIFYFYADGKCLDTKRNPSLAQLSKQLNRYTPTQNQEIPSPNLTKK